MYYVFLLGKPSRWVLRVNVERAQSPNRKRHYGFYSSFPGTTPLDLLFDRDESSCYKLTTVIAIEDGSSIGKDANR